MLFTDLRLSEPIQRAIQSTGYITPTPIQAQTIPHILQGKDVLGCAQTGTGKTAAFALPVLDKLSRDTPKPHGKRRARVLVLAPTRELASQIGESFQTYANSTGLKHACIFGGVGQGPQVKRVEQGLDILVATPGRLMDLMNQGHVDLRDVGVLILDEADRMLDMGFIPDIRKITKKLPQDRQTLLFSATMPNEIRKLAHDLLKNPVTIEVAAQSTTADRIEQRLYRITKKQKVALLAHLIDSESVSRTIVFSRTKHGCDKIVRQLRKYNIPAEAIHGNKTQNQRTRSLDRFRAGKAYVLVATDIASRGIDVDDVSHVFNFDLSEDPESYVHRIGRTARAGASGIAISFCDETEAKALRGIERLIKQKITVAETPGGLPEPDPNIAPPPEDKPSRGRSKPRNKKPRGGSRGESGQEPDRTPKRQKQKKRTGRPAARGGDSDNAGGNQGGRTRGNAGGNPANKPRRSNKNKRRGRSGGGGAGGGGKPQS